MYAAALILHPNSRIKYIRANWPRKWITPTIKKVTKLWEQYRDKYVVESLSGPLYDKQPEEKEKELDEFDQIAQGLRNYTRPSSQDEFEDYCAEAVYDIGDKISALQWWRQDAQIRRWPRLSRMAVDILSIPAMSDKAERVFSGARRTVTWDRTLMSPETLEQRECLKHWKKSGILNRLF